MSIDLTLKELGRAIEDLVGPELSQIIAFMTKDPGERGSPFIQIPKPDDVDRSVEELMSLVARTSNAYVHTSRLVGLSRAELKLAAGRYKRKHRSMLGAAGGSNQHAREAAAINASEPEAVAVDTLEALVEMAESMQSAARVASESARKMLDKVSDMKMGTMRGEHGQEREEDFH
jgi:hypothetical protein